MGKRATPGNWSVGKYGQTVVSDTDDLTGFQPNTGHSDKEYYGGVLICESIWKPADAKLISAAPDLQEALIEILPFAAEWINENHPTMKKAIAAIKKSQNNF